MIELKKESTNPPKKLDKKQAEAETESLSEELSALQSKLFAEQKNSLLIVLQGMDTSGKDGVISHVFSLVNPQGCNVRSFKAPTAEESAHDFLWRVYPHTPARGMIQIFNRSHYEDILYPTVHKTIPKKILSKRYKAINHFEEELEDSGTVILKFFLHVSKKEQSKRLKERLTDPRKLWKYNPEDQKEEKLFDKYMDVYEEILDKCGEKIPWHIIPADDKWYRNYLVAKKITHTLRDMKPEYPVMAPSEKNEPRKK